VSDEIEHRIPVIEERARIDKEAVERAVVKITTSIRETEHVLTDELRKEIIDIRRVPIGAEVDEVPAVREEGDITVIPIVEERAVIVKHLVLVEELHVHRRSVRENIDLPVTVRSTEVSVERRRSPSGEQT
jgi:uncharacterized protein (TIGR02271 family)